MTPEVPNEALSAARLKKKEAQKKSSKRKMSFLDRQHKIKRKTSSAHKETEKNMPRQTDPVENGPTPNEPCSKNYQFIGNFTDLLTTPIVEGVDDDTFRL